MSVATAVDADSGHVATNSPGSDATPGRSERGRITIDDRVVQKLAARAAIEIADAGASAPRVLGRSLNTLAGAAPGAVIRSTDLDSLPKVQADVDGSLVVLRLQLSVRWPASVPAVTQAVREHVRERVSAMTGLTVTEIGIDVSDLVTTLAPPPRVR